jgi:hypothetical protein
MRRFDLKMPCLICIVEPELPEDVFRMETRNISSDGAYIAGTTFPPATRITMEVLVRRLTETENGHADSCISVRGEVIRCDAGGMALHFDGQYQIARIAKMMAHGQAKLQWLTSLTSGDRPVPVVSPQTGASEVIADKYQSLHQVLTKAPELVPAQ